MIHTLQTNTTITLTDSATIFCEIGKRLVLVAEDAKPVERKKPRPSWSAIGNGMENRDFKSYPYEETLLALTANERKLFNLILKAYDRNTGYSVLDMSGFTNSEKGMLSLGYKALKQRSLIKRVKPRTYLINPTAKIHLSLFDELFAMWNMLP